MTKAKQYTTYDYVRGKVVFKLAIEPRVVFIREGFEFFVSGCPRPEWNAVAVYESESGCKVSNYCSTDAEAIADACLLLGTKTDQQIRDAINRTLKEAGDSALYARARLIENAPQEAVQ